MSIADHKELSRRLYAEVFGAGNVAAADEILAPECLSHAPGMAPLVGSDGIKMQAALLRGAIPDLKVRLEDQIAEDDRVASRWTGSGTHVGELRLPSGPVPPTRRPI
jgi:predicted ester cyclase